MIDKSVGMIFGRRPLVYVLLIRGRAERKMYFQDFDCWLQTLNSWNINSRYYHFATPKAARKKLVTKQLIFTKYIYFQKVLRQYNKPQFQSFYDEMVNRQKQKQLKEIERQKAEEDRQVKFLHNCCKNL